MAENSTKGMPAHEPDDIVPRLAEARDVLHWGVAAEAAEIYRVLQEEAARLGLVPERAAALVGLGDCALESGELSDARDHFAEAELLLADEPPACRAPARRGRATAHLLAGELRYCCHLLETALDELGTAGAGDPRALLALHTTAIAPYVDLGAYARAARAAELALALTAQVDDPVLVAGALRGAARTLVVEGRFAEAGTAVARARELCRSRRIRTELAHCHWAYGYVHAQDGHLGAAERELRTARAMLAAKRAPLFTVQVEVELADVLRRRGKADEAAGLLAPLLTPDALGAERGAVHAGGAHRLLGLMAEDRGDTDSAEEHYCAALSLLERTGAAGDLADLCRLLGDLLRRTGRTEAALNAYRTGLGHRAAPGTTTLGPAPAVRPRRPCG
ncbi:MULTISPECIES: tetratricopeptide repeat protein [Streptomyces]|uniref:tetratricopeptide repeat protein n=1 Tax=Streptomyces TaxID=1883 RepID=UPI00163CF120|nr:MULTISPECIES: tetratricopeptide repeat protein [Streptomyces]MBC2874799.1 tetratricopeptide repeat protein [Streptomyces sp. TYQ1024]UBI37254.1 tetratricopeptide repeat protein [Streptomyces mobaraensis]UKW29845.1 tetratricopeptide repeat protein [Streptomyces sp. TYQ1024]